MKVLEFLLTCTKFSTAVLNLVRTKFSTAVLNLVHVSKNSSTFKLTAVLNLVQLNFQLSTGTKFSKYLDLPVLVLFISTIY